MILPSLALLLSDVSQDRRFIAELRRSLPMPLLHSRSFDGYHPPPKTDIPNVGGGDHHFRPRNLCLPFRITKDYHTLVCILARKSFLSHMHT